MREGGKGAKGSGQSKAMCLEVRQLLRGTLSMMKQDCAYLLNQKHKSKPAGGVSRVPFMQTAPSPQTGPRGKLLSLCQLIWTFGSPKVGVGQGPAKRGSRDSAFSAPHQAWASHSCLQQACLKKCALCQTEEPSGSGVALSGERGDRPGLRGTRAVGRNSSARAKVQIREWCLLEKVSRGVDARGWLSSRDPAQPRGREQTVPPLRISSWL